MLSASQASVQMPMLSCLTAELREGFCNFGVGNSQIDSFADAADAVGFRRLAHHQKISGNKRPRKPVAEVLQGSVGRNPLKKASGTHGADPHQVIMIPVENKLNYLRGDAHHGRVAETTTLMVTRRLLARKQALSGNTNGLPRACKHDGYRHLSALPGKGD